MDFTWRGAACVAIAGLALAAPGAAAQTNAISTAAGTGSPGYSGDGGPASLAALSSPISVTLLPDGGYLIVDQGNSAVRRVAPDGTITTVAGDGTQGFSGDGGPALEAQLSAPNSAVPTPDGSILIADSNNNRIRRVAPDGTISTVAGGGGSLGDGGPAPDAQLAFPIDIAVTGNGDYLIADNDNHRIRFVSSLTGTISTIAGSTSGFSGDGGPAQDAQLNGPASVALTGDDGYLIADTDNQRVRKVTNDGTINTVAGSSATPGFSGDGGPATLAQFSSPVRVSAMFDGGFLIADRLNNRIRRVTRDGIVETAAGNGTAGFDGDGGPAPDAQLNQPLGVSVNAEGDYLIADTFNHRVRFVDAGAPPPPPPPPPGLPPPTIGSTANATPIAGTVLVKLPRGTSAARAKALGLAGGARGFIPLAEARQVPVGSTFQTSRGTVRLSTAASSTNPAATQDGDFGGGLFVLKQARANPLTTLTLKGGGLSKCRRRAGSRKEGVAAARRRRRLFSNARGRFRTRGRNSHATVRGTRWITTDTCVGTLTVVKQGSVRVRDFRKGRTRVVRAGQRYLARAPKRKQRRKRRR